MYHTGFIIITEDFWEVWPDLEVCLFTVQVLLGYELPQWQIAGLAQDPPKLKMKESWCSLLLGGGGSIPRHLAIYLFDYRVLCVNSYLETNISREKQKNFIVKNPTEKSTQIYTFPPVRTRAVICGVSTLPRTNK